MNWLHHSIISLRSKRFRAVSDRFGAKNEEPESKTTGRVKEQGEGSARPRSISRGQNQKSRSSVFLCSETKRKRLLRSVLNQIVIFFPPTSSESG